MESVVKVSESGSELVDYLDTLVNVQMYDQEVSDIKQTLLAADKNAQQIRPAPVIGKVNISRKVIVAVLIVGAVLGFVHILLFLASLAVIGVYIYSRIMPITNAYKKNVDAWKAEVEEKAQQRANIAAGLTYIDGLIHDCSNTLNRLYNAGPLLPSYRNLPACATFFDWLSKGVTLSLSQNGNDPGAYAMYDDKLCCGELMGELRSVKENFRAIQTSQARLYAAVIEMRNAINTISRQLIDFGCEINSESMTTTANPSAIKSSTAVSAYYSQVTAANSAALYKYVEAAAASEF